ncbi:MAG TPA: Fe-S cluster assembly protein HesB [Thermoanaerobaculia bacterium]|jgi:N-glycosylase/DNA lyase
MRLKLPSDFHFDRVVRSHGWYDLPPFVYDADRAELRTIVAGADGPVEIRFRARDGFLEARGALPAPALRAIASRVFSLDLDLSSFDDSLAGEPALRGALRRGAGRMLRAPTLFEDAVKMLFTTNCSWEATRGMVRRLIELAGEGGAFPTPERVASFAPGVLSRRVRCGYRAVSLSRFARRIARGRLDLAAWERRETSPEAVREAVLLEHGFGPYAAEGLMRVLGRHEYLALDSWVRKKYRQLHPGPAKSVDRAIARRYARFGEHKGLAMWLELTADWHAEDAKSAD